MLNGMLAICLLILVPYACYEILKDLNRAEAKAASEMEKLLTNRVDIRRVK